MDKMLGRFFLIASCYLVVVLNGGIRLDMHNADGVATNHFIAGQPIFMDVIIDEIQGSVQAPAVEGIEQLTARRTGMYMSSINGVTTTKYTYQLNSDQQGTFTVGPARLNHNNKEFISNSHVITIGHEQLTKGQVKNQQKAQQDLKAFLRLIVDENNVFVGQKIQAKLRFYYQDSSLSLSQIGQPSLVGFDTCPMNNPIGGVEEINGIRYRYAEWEWEMYPNQPGDLVIPAYSADYEIPSTDNRFFGGIFMFAGSRVERKRIYSNAVKVMVQAVNQGTVSVDAVGVFHSITATISPPIVKEGEGMVLTIEITGKGNLHAIKPLRLSMPPELKYYDSQVTNIAAESEYDLPKKRFEFIVQSSKAGEWEIPEQIFTYFDINRKECITLQTAPLTISVQPSQSKQDAIVEEQINSKKNNERESSLPSFRNFKGPWYPIQERKPLSGVVFLFFLIVPFLCMIYGHYHTLIKNLEIYLLNGSKRRAYRTARKKINGCKEQADMIYLHTIFMNYLSDLTHKNVSELSPDQIHHYIRNSARFSVQEVQEWNLFINHLARIAYANDYHNENVGQLSRTAIQWLNRLKK